MEECEAGERLDDFLAARLGWVSRIRIRAAIRAGRCLLNGRPAERGMRLKAGDDVSITLDLETPTGMRPDPLPLEILYEDSQLIVVVKPAGMLVHPTRGVKVRTLANALSYHWNPFLVDSAASKSETAAVIRPGFVHRLDRLTSGLLVVAKSTDTMRYLSLAFARRQVEKRYLAIVQGRIGAQDFTVEAAIGRLSETRPHFQVAATGKPATTRMRVMERKPANTLLELEPLTGRTNQLRIHCAHLGHPILGDATYGGPSAVRLCLHASFLAFRHPVTGRPVEFESPMPAEMSEIWNSLPT